jgi:hypothetical protein
MWYDDSLEEKNIELEQKMLWRYSDIDTDLKIDPDRICYSDF